MRVSDNRRYLVDTSGKPFFYLADTAWRLLYCTDHAMADRYLRKRRDQGFSVFMTVLHSEVFGSESETNRFGTQSITPIEDGGDGDYVLIAEVVPSSR